MECQSIGKAEEDKEMEKNRIAVITLKILFFLIFILDFFIIVSSFLLGKRQTQLEKIK